MNPADQRIAMAALDGFIWYRQRNGSDPATDYWGVARFCLPPEEGIANPGTYATVRGTQLMTDDEVAEAKRTGGFYTYAPTYASLDDVARVEGRLTSTQFAAYYGELYQRHHRGMMSIRYQQWMPVIRATAPQRTECLLRATGKWISSP